MQPQCKLCGSGTTLITHPRFGDFQWCRQCDFIGKDKAFYLSKERELAIYNRHQNSIEDPRYVAFFTRFLEAAVLPYMNTGREGFDFGSGPSPVLAQILERHHGFKMDLYDPFFAPQKTDPGRRYDLITATEVVEHLADPLPTFRSLVDAMKDDAIFSVMTLFHPRDEKAFLNWHYIRDRTHISFYTPRTLDLIARKVGLRVLYTDHVRYITFSKEAEPSSRPV